MDENQVETELVGLETQQPEQQQQQQQDNTPETAQEEVEQSEQQPPQTNCQGNVPNTTETAEQQTSQHSPSTYAWYRVFDALSQQYYYYDAQSGYSYWQLPHGVDPSILPDFASAYTAQQQQYYDSYQQYYQQLMQSGGVSQYYQVEHGPNVKEEELVSVVCPLQSDDKQDIIGEELQQQQQQQCDGDVNGNQDKVDDEDDGSSEDMKVDQENEQRQECEEIDQKNEQQEQEVEGEEQDRAHSMEEQKLPKEYSEEQDDGAGSRSQDKSQEDDKEQQHEVEQQSTDESSQSQQQQQHLQDSQYQVQYSYQAGWYYYDLQQQVQGPFSNDQLRVWRSQLPMDLQLWFCDPAKGDKDEPVCMHVYEVLGDKEIYEHWQKATQGNASGPAPSAPQWQEFMQMEQDDSNGSYAAAARAGLPAQDTAVQTHQLHQYVQQQIPDAMNFYYWAQNYYTTPGMEQYAQYASQAVKDRSGRILAAGSLPESATGLYSEISSWCNPTEFERAMNERAERKRKQLPPSVWKKLKKRKQESKDRIRKALLMM
eukprot:TRINITY_DN8156_c0_g1_i4.p2 TRINITY_DN8156_c0_g1~~TRINITY_DN8156_c0_g1_i4.p2  ORF type:complete len:558 (+),score=101.59 TRINITY_DN8156_c0_g1_i4:56-1675(+)